MPEIPKDPRQLARDILSGKITIEEVARARRSEMEAGQRGGGTGGAMGPRVPDKIPLPKVSPTKPPLIRGPVPQGPVARRPAPIPQQVPKRVPTQNGPRLPGKPTSTPRRPMPPVAGQTVSVPPRGPNVLTTAAAGVPNPTVAVTASPALRAMPVESPKMVSADSPVGIRAMMASGQGLRQAVLMSEILGRPVSLRDGW